MNGLVGRVNVIFVGSPDAQPGPKVGIVGDLLSVRTFYADLPALPINFD